MDIGKLSQALEQADRDETSKRYAQKLIEKATPAEMSLAEQKLLERGMDECKLKDLCKLHLETVRDRVKELKESVEPGHPIHTFVSEHEEILGYVDEIEKVTDNLENKELTEDEKKTLRKSAENLLDAEKHHDREEKTIFPRLEKKGISGPPRIMQMEHDELRERKQALFEASKDPDKNKEKIDRLADYIIYNLREHIFKEDNILYPTALKEIKDWDKVKKECNSIGYCRFTPKK